MLIVDCSRPIDEMGRRVTPSTLSDHRITYQFKAPCCVCAENSPTADYIETAIYVATSGPYFGEYVAGCALNKCGYLSKLE
jgi:hypothetical protein